MLLLFALSLLLLLAIAGFSIDVGNLYVNIERAQRAADSAALAGTVYLPDDPTAAIAAANQVLAENHFPGHATLDATDLAHPDHMHVTIAGSIPTLFAKVVGVDAFNFSRTGIAVYMPPIAMGSPNNVLGSEPGSTMPMGIPSSPFWLSISGENSHKSEGERWTAGNCELISNPTGCMTQAELAAKPASIPPRCVSSPATAFCNAAVVNTEFQDSKNFTVQVDPGPLGDLTTGTLSIEVYDATFAPAGQNCDDPHMTYVASNMPAALTTPVPLRFATGTTSYCTGEDNIQNDDPAPDTYPAMDTTFTISRKGPGGSTAILTDCSPTYAGVMTFPGLKNGDTPAEWVTELSTFTSDPQKPYNAFHNWVELCRLPIGSGPHEYPAGKYNINVKPSAGSASANNFALRAEIVGNPTYTSRVHIFSPTQLTTVSNFLGVHPYIQLAMAKVSPSAGGHTLHVEAYDMGDGGHIDTFSLLPGGGFTNADGTPMTQFSCRQTLPQSTTPEPPMPSCSIPNLDGNLYDTHVTSFAIDLPAGFSCDATQPLGCWVMAKLEYLNNNIPNDGISWSANMDGSPIHLLNN